MTKCLRSTGGGRIYLGSQSLRFQAVSVGSTTFGPVRQNITVGHTWQRDLLISQLQEVGTRSQSALQGQICNDLLSPARPHLLKFPISLPVDGLQHMAFRMDISDPNPKDVLIDIMYLISLVNTLTDPKTIFKQLSGHPVAY